MTTNEIVRLHNAYDIAEHWSFFREAMKELNDPRRANTQYTPEEFFNMLVRIVDLGERGLVCLLTSKNGKYLGFGCGFQAETFDFDKCFYVWQAYSNRKCKTCLTEMLTYCEHYAKSTLSLKSIKISTPRMTGAADKLFESILGFKREFYTYNKTL